MAAKAGARRKARTAGHGGRENCRCLTEVQFLVVLRQSAHGSEPSSFINGAQRPDQCSFAPGTRRTTQPMTRQTPALLFLALVAAGFALWFLLKPDPQRSALGVREIATRGFAEHLARAHPGAKVLIVSNPFTQRKDTARAIVDMEQAGIRGLREGFGGKISVEAVAFPELKPEARENPAALLVDVETTAPLSYLMTADAIDQLARQHANCDLIVSLVGIPLHVTATEAWKSVGAPRFALLLPDLKILGNTASLKASLKSGKLAAFVLPRPGAPGDDTPPGRDWKTEFEKRFLLVTPENVEQVMQAHPKLFAL
jgi:hypothetical protein